METWRVYERGLIPGTEIQNVSLGWNDTVSTIRHKSWYSERYLGTRCCSQEFEWEP